MDSFEHLLRNRVLDEIGAALGVRRTSPLRYALRPWFWLPASRFARVASRFEAQVPGAGLPGGARQMCADLSIRVTLCSQPDLPAEGPVLVVSNHPGAYNSIAIIAHLPRPDLKILVSDVPFLRAFPETSRRFIFVAPGSSERMAALRQAVAHLKAGGALMLFPHGDVEPDPAFMPGAHKALGIGLPAWRSCCGRRRRRFYRSSLPAACSSRGLPAARSFASGANPSTARNWRSLSR